MSNRENKCAVLGLLNVAGATVGPFSPASLVLLIVGAVCFGAMAGSYFERKRPS